MRRRGRLIATLVPVLALLVGCAAPPSPTTSPTPSSTESATTSFVTLSPVPLMLTVPAALAERIWVAPLTGPDISALDPAAAVQLQFRRGAADEPMVANLLWFPIARYTQVMASAEAPKGIEIGFQGDHVLFVQPALDMPFDPASQDGADYGTLVERAREFRWYGMSDPSLTLLRPCPVYDAMPTVLVDSAMLTAITKYFTQQGLAPATLITPTAKVLDMSAQELGTHECANPDGGLGGYGGAVPTGASEAVMAYVRHKPYEATGADSTFVTLAKMPGLGWMVVSEGTGP